MKYPNILFIFSDQQRHDTLGCYNENIDFTPNLDKLAQKGILFENTFTCQPVCGPARSCLQTGLYATQTRCYRNDIGLPENVTTIADRFNENGYETAYIGKWHLASTGDVSNEEIGKEEAFHTTAIPFRKRGGYKDYWLAADCLEATSHAYGGYMFDTDNNRVDFEGYRVDRQTDYVIDYLNNRKTDKPFFLFTSYLEPHHQNDCNHYVGPEGSKEKFKNYNIPEDLKNFSGDWNEEYPDYLGCCESLDRNVGRIVETLKKLSKYDETVIIYTSDHGSHFMTRNDEYKRSCHDSCIHIPLIISGREFVGGKRIKELVSLIDLPKTLLDIAGIALPEELQGNSLLKLVTGASGVWPKEVFLQISESQVGRAIRTDKWKYSVSALDKDGILDMSSDHYTEEFLYDLENDPNELINLVSDPKYEPVRENLKKILIRRMLQAGERAPVISNRGN